MSSRRKILEWAEQGRVAPQQASAALRVAGVLPDANDWGQFLNRLLLALGTALLVSGVIFFLAANWDALGRFGHFALVQAALLASLLLAWRLDSTLGGKAAMVASALLVGALLALAGQTYQTGADNWELFFTWTLLITPWVLLARMSVLWLIWLTLLNLSAVTYVTTYQGLFGILFGPSDLLWLLFTINTSALLIWQGLAVIGNVFATEQWPIRLLATASGVCITMLALETVLGSSVDLIAILVWFIWLGSIYLMYRRKTVDLYILTGSVLSFIVVLSSFLGKHLLQDVNTGSLLLMTFIVLGLSAIGGWWLRQILKETHQ